MGSLHDMLIKDGFDDYRKIKSSKKKLKLKDQDQTLSIIDESTVMKMKSTEIRHCSRASLCSGESISPAGKFRSYEPPPIEEVAIRAAISIMSGYLEQYLKDQKFRRSIRAKCSACFRIRNEEKNLDNGGVIAKLETMIENIEKLVEETRLKSKEETRLNSLKCSIRLLNILAELNSKNSRNQWTSGIPNSHLSAIAQLYLAILYKLEKNGRISAMHLIQVFIDAPLLARIHLIPQLWENLFLPHLLHLRIWKAKEVEFVKNPSDLDNEIKISDLNEVYDAQMDIGTVKFAVYYKEWLKIGVQGPAFPVVFLLGRRMDLHS